MLSSIFLKKKLDLDPEDLDTTAFFTNANISESDAQILNNGKNPLFIYDVLIYLKLIHNIDDVRLRDVKERLVLVDTDDDDAVKDIFSDLGITLFDPSQDRWGTYRKKEYDLQSFVTQVSNDRLENNIRAPSFKFIPTGTMASITSVIDKTAQTYNVNNNVDTRSTDRVLVYDIEMNYLFPEAVRRIYRKYRSSVSSMRVDGLTEEIPNPEYKTNVEFTEKMRRELQRFKFDTLDSIKQELLNSHSVPKLMLDSLSKWPNEALLERKHRIHNICSAYAFTWTRETITRFWMHMEKQGWTTKIDPAGTQNGFDIIFNAEAFFYTNVIRPVISSFSIEILDRFDYMTFPQTKQEAREIVLEYLHLRLMIILGQNDEETISVIKVLKQMIYSFPFEEIGEVVETFNKFYSKINPTRRFQEAVKRVYMNEKPWLNIVREYWISKGGQDNKTANGFWISYNDEDIGKMISDYLDIKMASIISTGSDRYSIVRFFSFLFIGSFYSTVQTLQDGINDVDVVKWITLFESYLYRDYMSMLVFSDGKAAKFFEEEVANVSNLYDNLAKWNAELSEGKYNQLFEVVTDTVREITATGNAVNIEAMRVALVQATDLVKSTFSYYLANGVRPSFLPYQDRAQIDSALDSFSRWFSIYTIAGDRMQNYNVPKDIDVIYAIYANTRKIAEGIIPETISIPISYTVRNNDRTDLITLPIEVRFIPKETVVLKFRWLRETNGLNHHLDPVIIREDVMTFEDTQIRDSAKNALDLSFPFTAGIYWCRVEAYAEANNQLTEVESSKVRLDVNNLCARCKNLYPDREISKKDTFTYSDGKRAGSFNIGSERDDTTCQWYLDSKKYMELEKHRAFLDSKNYSAYEILDDLVRYIKTEDTTNAARFRRAMEKFFYVPITITRGVLKLEEADSDVIYLSKTTQRLVNPNYILTQSYENIRKMFVESIPYIYLLRTLIMFCSSAIEEDVISILCDKSKEYFAHFLRVVKNLEKKLVEQKKTKDLMDVETTKRRDWISQQNLAEHIGKKNKNDERALINVNERYTFDQDGFDAYHSEFNALNRSSIFPGEDFNFMYRGVHDPSNILPDGISVSDSDGNDIFWGLRTQTKRFDDYDPIGNAFRTLFDDQIDENNDDVKPGVTLVLMPGSVRMLKKNQLESIFNATRPRIEEINSLLASRMIAPNNFNIKPVIRNLLLEVSDLYFQYNQTLLSDF